MKWMVLWIVVTSHNVPCPQAGPTIDEFGIVHENGSYTLQLCCETSKKNMQREFETVESAQEFVSKGEKECGVNSRSNIFSLSTCQDFEIKEMKPLPLPGR